jgi:aminoglycoside phosphotransferase (APT) family kinase protein
MYEKVRNKFQLDVKEVIDVEDSNSSTVYKCVLMSGESVYVKIPFSQLKWQREWEAYDVLKNHVAIPNLLASWAGDEAFPGAFLLSSLKGKPLHETASLNVSYQVGQLLANLHEVKPPKPYTYTGIRNEYEGWYTFLTKQFSTFAEDVKTVLPQELFDQCVEKFYLEINQLPKPDGPSFVHMDFRPANILVDGDEVVGVIDFESVRFGAVELDFVKIYRDFLQDDEERFIAFKKGYASIRTLPDLSIFLPFYSFMDAFNSIGWCVRRGRENHQAFLAENIEIIRSYFK